MRVAELRAVLAEIPGDWLVTVGGRHVDEVRRQFAYHHPVIGRVKATCEDCGQVHEHYGTAVMTEFPAAIDLDFPRGGAPAHRGIPEWPVSYTGRWTKAQQEVIDRFSDDPDLASPDGEGH